MKHGWEIKQLGDVCELYQPKTISSKEMVDDGDYPVFGANGIIGKYDKYNHEEPQLLITCRGATCGSINISEPKSWINGNAMVVRPKDNSLNLKFIEYLFLGGIDISKTITGAAQPQITRQTLSPVLISYPKSLPEQQRIVAILDEAFAAIAKAKANAEQNLKNAKELFESYLQGVFENKGEGSKFETLDSLCELIVDCEHKTAPTQETGYPSIRTPNIGKGVLILEGVNRVSEKTYNEWTRRAIPQADDLILAREAPAGNIAVIPENVKVCLGQRTVLIRPKKNKLISKFLAHLILSKDVQEQLLSHSTGATVEHINMKDIRAFKIYNLSPLTEQQTIVQNLEALLTETQKLEAIYQQKINDLEELKKSVLQKAFSGELKSPEGALFTNDGCSPSKKEQTV